MKNDIANILQIIEMNRRETKRGTGDSLNIVLGAGLAIFAAVMFWALVLCDNGEVAAWFR